VRFAADVSELELADYQRAVRLLLRHPLITATWPDERALARVRRFSAELRRDLSEAFGYRLELHGSTARLVRTTDALDPDRPAVTRTGRPFDRRRYAYLALSLAVTGRAGIQITLSELADAVAADANRITGLGFDPDQGVDRRALVDAIGWLEERGVLRLADGSAASWAGNPGAGEALYDIARDVVFALFRPPRVLQHVGSATALLERAMSRSGNADRRAAAQAARRAVVQSPVVYYSDVAAEVGNHLRAPVLAADLHRLTGLRVERRAEGVLLIDTTRLSAEQFPGTGSVAQAAVLLAAVMAERATDPDGRRVKRMTAPDPGTAQAVLASQVDVGLPAATHIVAPPPPPARLRRGRGGHPGAHREDGVGEGVPRRPEEAGGRVAGGEGGPAAARRPVVSLVRLPQARDAAAGRVPHPPCLPDRGRGLHRLSLR
jgi:uncharacterized protein (TIGR02678 family)